MPRRHDRKGRSQHGPPFVRLFRYMLTSAAWLSLSTAARSAYVEIANRYIGNNNGSLGMSVRHLASRLRCSKDTAARALRELDDKGFIRTMKIGSYSRKDRRASEYGLTAHPCDLSNHPATNEFMHWQPFSQSGRKDRTVRSKGHAKENYRRQSDSADCEPNAAAPDRPN
jgi:DNA-binding MarR family transcriptional regulator